MSKQSATRALMAYFGRRVLRIATIVTCTVLFVVILIAGFLAYQFAGWWWLLTVPFALLFLLFLLLRLVASFIIGRIYSERLDERQDEALAAFSAKIERLVEARGTPPPLFVLITIKDLLLHRDITTIKSIVSDTASLRSDYRALERLFE